jgi:antitoxin CptB
VNNKNLNEFINQPSRLKWMCRRGMLELDVLFGKFLETGYPKLTDEEKCLFVQLLDCPDPDLLGWLLGTDEPAEDGLKHIVGKIKQHVQSRI